MRKPRKQEIVLRLSDQILPISKTGLDSLSIVVLILLP